MKSGAFVGNIAATSHGLRRYGQLIVTLLRQEELNRRRAPMESIVNLLEPVVMIGTLTSLWWFLGNRTFVILGGSPVLFYGTGFFALYFFIYISRRMRSSVDLPMRRFPIERRLDHIIVHILLRIADYSVLGILLFGTLYFFFTSEAIPHDIVSMAIACATIVMLGFGWGILNMILSRRYVVWARVSAPFNRSLVLVSGVFFIPDFLSPSVRYVLSFNPLLHAIALFRQGFYPNYPTILLDTAYLGWSAVVALVGGLVLERITRRSEQS